MKKTLLVSIAFFLLLNAHAQFLNGFGLMGGATFARQKWEFSNPSYTQKQKYIIGFNAEVFADFLTNDYFNWRTEIQFNQKGCIDKSVGEYSNRVNYFSWNNYLKFHVDLYSGIAYLLIGPRVEYVFSQSSSPIVTGSYHQLHVNGSVGAGWEFVAFSQLKPLVEVHYNPDIVWESYKHSNLSIKNRVWEIRIGCKYQLNSRKTTCPKVYK